MATATKPMMLDETGKQIVDELKKIADVKGSAIGTTFDDTNAHLGTNNVQGAIDKLKSNADTLAGNVTTAEQNINTNTQNIATNAEAISQHSSQIAEISDEIKVEKSVVVDDYALVESGSGVLNDLILYGRSKQDKTTGKNLSSVQYGVTWNSDGTGFTSDVKRVSFDVPIDCSVQKKYAFSWVNNSNTRVSLYARFKDTSGAMHTDLLFASNAINEGRAITVSSDYVMAYFFLVAETSESSIEIIKKVVNLQIEKGDSVTPYEPYTNGPSPNPQYPSAIRALSGIKTENEDKSESTESAIPTNCLLYGIPVSSGGNYTDKSGQHWASDVLDLDSGVITRCIKKITLKMSDSVERQNGNDGTTGCQFDISDRDVLKNDSIAVCASDKLIGVSFNERISTDNKNKFRVYCRSGYTIILRATTSVTTYDAFAQMIGETIDVYYVRSTPVTEPIPQSILNSIRQLRSFADSTHIYCDNGSLEAVIAENTEVGNAIGRNAIKINEILNLLNPVTASVSEEE